MGEVRRREVMLEDLIKLNQLLDAQAAAQDAEHKKGTK